MKYHSVTLLLSYSVSSSRLESSSGERRLVTNGQVGGLVGCMVDDRHTSHLSTVSVETALTFTALAQASLYVRPVLLPTHSLLHTQGNNQSSTTSSPFGSRIQQQVYQPSQATSFSHSGPRHFNSSGSIALLHGQGEQACLRPGTSAASTKCLKATVQQRGSFENGTNAPSLPPQPRRSQQQ